ncbi:hypothetical protein [Spirillospora sp. CA-128828]|uniref:hypothetical protein n=1 Tax=Spirillospora sp. CA-128828 TaxID=3240033 RepID=UPI003D8D12EA
MTFLLVGRYHLTHLQIGLFALLGVASAVSDGTADVTVAADINVAVLLGGPDGVRIDQVDISGSGSLPRPPATICAGSATAWPSAT